MRVLRLGCKGDDVGDWQAFLRGSGYNIEITNEFDKETEIATHQFQVSKKLDPADGEVEQMTYGEAILSGYGIISDDSDKINSANWPPKPYFSPFSQQLKIQLFGQFSYKPAGSISNPEAIVITDNWPSLNIVNVEIPQLKNVTGAPANCTVQFHRKGAEQLKQLFIQWESEGLIDKILSYGGTWAPRFVRGSKTYLSNHSFGAAIDLNVAWNGLGMLPALANKKGSVRKLVPIANKLGFYWGGHWGGPGSKQKVDGMHFELAIIK